MNLKAKRVEKKEDVNFKFRDLKAPTIQKFINSRKNGLKKGNIFSKNGLKKGNIFSKFMIFF